MEIVSDFKVSSVYRTEPGELVLLRFREASAFAIHLFQGSGGRPVFAVLNPKYDGKSPFHLAMDTDEPCLSYGTNWTMQIPASQASYYKNQEYLDAPGAIYLSDSDFVIKLSRFSGTSDDGDIYFNITEWRPVGSLFGPLIPFTKWAILPAEPDPKTGKREPIFEFALQD